MKIHIWIAKWFLTIQIRTIPYYWKYSLQYLLCPRILRTTLVLAFWISILKISKLLQNYWHRVIDITSFEKHLESSLDHTLNFCRNLEFGGISFQEYLSKGISHPVVYGDLVNKLRRVKNTPNFISSGSKIVKRLRRRQYDPVIIERPLYSLVQTFP